MKVYLVTHEVEYEGSSLISISGSKLGAKNSAEQYLRDNYPDVDPVKGADGNYYFSDSTIRIEQKEVTP